MSFSDETFKFLRQLQKNNRRDWFEKNKDRYEGLVREPAFEFINKVAPLLKKISPHFLAVAKKTGGSLMRVYRDTRFSKDKTPYKTNVGIQFRHEFGKDVHAPGYYVHLHPDESFVGLGIWHPDPKALKSIRNHLVDDPLSWKRAIGSKSFKSNFELAGESLKKAPLGFEKDHPMIEDLRRKDFIAVTSLQVKDITRPDFARRMTQQFKQGTALMRFLCDALRVPF